MVNIEPPVGIFSLTTGSRGLDRDPDWADLPENEKEVYRGRSEARRREAWAWFEGWLNWAAPTRLPSPTQPGPLPERWVGRQSDPFGVGIRETIIEIHQPPAMHPPLAIPVYGFEVFRDEMVAEAGDGGVGFWEVLGRWEALPDRDRIEYNDKASEKTRRLFEEVLGISLGPGPAAE